jgi:FAD:protein FMN transferase
MTINITGGHIKSDFFALGTDISIDVIAPGGNSREVAGISGYLEEVERVYRKMEKILSRFEVTSELSRLNQNLGVFQKVSPEILYLADKSLQHFQASGGIFDPRIIGVLEDAGYRADYKSLDFEKSRKREVQKFPVPDLSNDLKIKDSQVFTAHRLDFSGIAKGYITDQAAGFLKTRGQNNFLIDSGGDIFAAGQDENSQEWNIMIEGASDEVALGVSDKGIATSGITRRKWEADGKKFHHLINPQNPSHFSFDLQSATVIAESCEEADVWAKVLFLLGKEEGIWIAEKKRLAVAILDYRGSIYVSNDFKNYMNR